jgi:hypothetical protein
MALSEKSPYLGGVWVRLSLPKNPDVRPDDLLGRDRSPSGSARLAAKPCINVHVTLMFLKKLTNRNSNITISPN